MNEINDWVPAPVPPEEASAAVPQPMTSPYVPRPPVPFVCDAHEKRLLGIAAGLGVALSELLLWGTPGVSILLLTGLAYAGIFAYGRGCATFDARRGAILDVPIAVTTLCCAIFANEPLAMGNVLLLYFLLALRIHRMFGHALPEGCAALAESGIAAPFCNAGAWFRTLRAPGRGARSRVAARAALGGLISIPVAAVVLALLRSAEPAFDRAMNRLALHGSEAILHVWIDICAGAVLAIFLFSLAYTARYGRPASQKSASNRLDSVIVGTVLVVCAGIYLCFFAVQFRYLFSAVWGHLPSEYIYAEYARRGFFELALVASINLLLTHTALRTQSADRPGIQVMVVVLSAETLVLIGSALSKMGMYIRVYGLTPLRLYTSVLMVGLALGFIGQIVARFVRVSMKNGVVIAAIALYLALNLSAPNAVVAQWNVRHFESGALPTVDFELLRDLGADAVPALIRLTTHGDAEIRAQAWDTLDAVESDLCAASQDVRGVTLSGQIARARIARLQKGR